MAKARTVGKEELGVKKCVLERKKDDKKVTMKFRLGVIDLDKEERTSVS